MANCNIPSFSFGFSLPGLPPFPTVGIPIWNPAFSIPCPLD